MSTCPALGAQHLHLCCSYFLPVQFGLCPLWIWCKYLTVMLTNTSRDSQESALLSLHCEGFSYVVCVVRDISHDDDSCLVALVLFKPKYRLAHPVFFFLGDLLS